jgi:hypothetical protein
LEVRVDGVKWREVPTFYKSGPKDRVYLVRRADNGTTTVQFGDGRRGARLPTGRENVQAVYRKGIGLEGIVKEEQIGLMLTQPLGVKGVTNLLAPQGAEEPQSLDDARVNAPRTVLTLDRVVSLQDYEDFARDFPGVDKAHAAWIWSGQTRGILLTLLGPDALAWIPIARIQAVLEEHLKQLYDNHFVETAAPWVLPYLGDLLGIRGLPAGAMARSPRAEVGHTVAYRRRKGTAPMLELLARDITGWPTRAVEFFERLAATQHLNHVRPLCRSFASLRGARELEFIGTPFESAMRTVEVRRIAAGRGRWNISNIGLFLWRLRSYSRTASPLAPVGELRPGDPLATRRFRVHPFGFDSQLFVRPVTEDDVTHLAEPMNVPLPVTRRMLTADAEKFLPVETLYGPGLSASVEEFVDASYRHIPAARVIVCDLSDARDARTIRSGTTSTKPHWIKWRSIQCSAASSLRVPLRTPNICRA